MFEKNVKKWKSVKYETKDCKNVQTKQETNNEPLSKNHPKIPIKIETVMKMTMRQLCNWLIEKKSIIIAGNKWMCRWECFHFEVLVIMAVKHHFVW